MGNCISKRRSRGDEWCDKCKLPHFPVVDTTPENGDALVSELLRRLENIDAMKDFQGFINRDNALWDLGRENWDLEDALETFLLDRGINHGTKCWNQRNALSINMTGDTDQNTSGLSNQRDKGTSEKLDDEDFLTSHPLLENKWNSSFKVSRNNHDINRRCNCNLNLGVSAHRIIPVKKKGSSLSPAKRNAEHIILLPLLECFDLLDFDREGDEVHDFRNEYWEIEKMQQKLKSEYGDVIKEKHNKLIVIPSRFQDTKDVSIQIEDLKSKIKEMKAKVSSDKEKDKLNKELAKKMEGVLHDFEGNVTEHKVYATLCRIFQDKRGLLLHSFKPERFLSVLTQRAKKQREKNSDLGLSNLELKLAEILGIEVENEVLEIMDKLKGKIGNITTISEQKLASLMFLLTKDEQKKLKKEQIKNIQQLKIIQEPKKGAALRAVFSNMFQIRKSIYEVEKYLCTENFQPTQKDVKKAQSLQINIKEEINCIFDELRMSFKKLHEYSEIKNDSEIFCEASLTSLDKMMLRVLGIIDEVDIDSLKANLGGDIRVEKVQLLEMLDVISQEEQKSTESKIRALQEKQALLKSIFDKGFKEAEAPLFSLEDIKKVLSIGLLHYYLKPDGECDFVTILADKKQIYISEVKQGRSDEHGLSRVLLDDASKQANRTEKYLRRILAPFVSSEWQIVKLAFVFPGELDGSVACSCCDNAIVTDKSINEIENRLSEILPHNFATTTNKEDNDYLNIFELLVCSISTSTYTSAWKWVVGSKASQAISAGYTESRLGKGSFGTDSISMSTKKEELKQAMEAWHDVSKLLFFSFEQLKIVMSSLINIVLFGDYGSGKSLVVKEKTFILKASGKPVIFISLGSCEPLGLPYDLPIIFDVITSREMACHEIKFLSVVDLVEHQKKRNKEITGNIDDRFSSSSKSNLEFAYKATLKCVRRETTFEQRSKMFLNHNVDESNGVDFYNSQNKKKTRIFDGKDVYELASAYINDYPSYTYVFDETPVLMNKITLRFDDGSLKNLEDFLTKANSCIKEANPGNSIIAAIQSNNLTDIGAGYPRKWNASVQKLTEQLDKKNFQSSFLTSNFRNSSEVYEAVKTMKINEEQSTKIQEALKVAKKGTSLSSSNPEMFNFNWQIRHVNQQDLKKAVEAR